MSETVVEKPLSIEQMQTLDEALRGMADHIAGRVYSPRIKLLDIEQVCEATRLGKTTVYGMMEKGLFPKPQKNLGKNLWRESAIISWLDANDPNRV